MSPPLLCNLLELCDSRWQAIENFPLQHKTNALAKGIGQTLGEGAHICGITLRLSGDVFAVRWCRLRGDLSCAQ